MADAPSGSCDVCTYDSPLSLIRRTASSLNSRVNLRLSNSLQLPLSRLRYLDGVEVSEDCAEFVNFEYELRHVRMACEQTLS